MGAGTRNTWGILLVPPSCQEWQSSTCVGDVSEHLPVYLSGPGSAVLFAFTLCLTQGLKQLLSREAAQEQCTGMERGITLP